jgi:uncharacterized protein (DUF1499 family)
MGHLWHLLHVLVGLVFPLCAYEGAEGVPVPREMDLAAIVRPGTPNTALAAQEGFNPAPDIVTRHYDVAPERLFAAMEAVAQGQARSFEQTRIPNVLQAHFVVRSWLMNFPDLVTIAVTGDGGVVIWSRSLYGKSDLGVNRARVEAWLAALDAALSKP